MKLFSIRLSFTADSQSFKMDLRSKIFLFILFLNIFPTIKALSYFDNSAAEIFTRFFYKMSPSNTDFASLRRQNQNNQDKLRKRRTITTQRVCDENTLMLNLATLEIKSPDRIISMASAGNLYEYCQKIKKNLAVTDALLKQCVPLEHENNLYIRLINGTRQFHNLSCTIDSKYQKGLDKHMTCLTQLHEEFLECEGPDDWYEESRGICDEYETILSCNYIKVGELCGLEAAHYMHVIGKQVFDTVLPKGVKCEMSQEPSGVMEAFQESLGTHTQSNVLFSVIFSILLHVITHIKLHQ